MYKNIITKAIGTAPRVAPTIETTDVLQGDIYIMCSDGLSDLLTEEEIRTIVLEAESTEAATELLVASANAKGGYDNVTVVILKVEGIVENHGSEDLSR